MRGLTISWLTRIESGSPACASSTCTLRGPYALWHHTHTFEPDGAGGTR
jgi:ligand-binding SRPBCC domain-containing protein